MDAGKSGAAIDALLGDASVIISIALQYDIPASAVRNGGGYPHIYDCGAGGNRAGNRLTLGELRWAPIDSEGEGGIRIIDRWIETEPRKPLRENRQLVARLTLGAVQQRFEQAEGRNSARMRSISRRAGAMPGIWWEDFAFPRSLEGIGGGSPAATMNFL